MGIRKDKDDETHSFTHSGFAYDMDWGTVILSKGMLLEYVELNQIHTRRPMIYFQSIFKNYSKNFKTA